MWQLGRGRRWQGRRRGRVKIDIGAWQSELCENLHHYLAAPFKQAEIAAKAAVVRLPPLSLSARVERKDSELLLALRFRLARYFHSEVRRCSRLRINSEAAPVLTLGGSGAARISGLHRIQNYTVPTREAPQTAKGFLVSGNFFANLGIAGARGRMGTDQCIFKTDFMLAHNLDLSVPARISFYQSFSRPITETIRRFISSGSIAPISR